MSNAHQRNAGIFATFKGKLANVAAVDKWAKVVQRFRAFTADAKAYYKEARPEIVECVQIATGAVLGLLPPHARAGAGPVNAQSFAPAHRPALDELQRLLVTVGAYQFEFVDPDKPEDTNDRPSLVKLRACLTQVGLDPLSLLRQEPLLATMRAVGLDEDAQARIKAYVAKRKAGDSTASSPALSVPAMSSLPPSRANSIAGSATSASAGEAVRRKVSLSSPRPPAQTPAPQHTATAPPATSTPRAPSTPASASVPPTPTPRPANDPPRPQAPLPPSPPPPPAQPPAPQHIPAATSAPNVAAPPPPPPPPAGGSAPPAPAGAKKRKTPKWMEKDTEVYLKKKKRVDGPPAPGAAASPGLPAAANPQNVARPAIAPPSITETAPPPAAQPAPPAPATPISMQLDTPPPAPAESHAPARPNRAEAQALLKALLAAAKRPPPPPPAKEKEKEKERAFRWQSVVDDAARQLREFRLQAAEDAKAGDGATQHVSFDGETAMADIEFGRPEAGTFTLHVTFRPEQWRMVEQWKTAVDDTVDLSQALSVSLVCYHAADVRAFRESLADEAAWDSALARSLTPASLHDPLLSALGVTINDHLMPTLPSMGPATADRLLDLTPYLLPGPNALTLDARADLSDRAFVLLVHPPTSAQVARLRARREGRERVREILGRPFEVPRLHG